MMAEVTAETVNEVRDFVFTKKKEKKKKIFSEKKETLTKLNK